MDILRALYWYVLALTLIAAALIGEVLVADQLLDAPDTQIAEAR